MEYKTSESQRKANRKYQSKMSKVQIEVNKETEQDILTKLKSVPSKQAYIKNLIKADIKKDNKNK